MLHILTLTWNGLAKLQTLKPTLEASLANINYTWHIRDNGSKDETLNTVKDWENTQSYDIGHNRDTFAQGMNYLFEKANPADDDFVLLLNNDVEFGDTTSISKMIDLHFKTKSDVVGARLLYKGTNKLQHAGVIFSDRYNRMPYHYLHQQECNKTSKQNRYFQSVTAAVCLVTVSSFKKVGGFDTAFRWAFDDTDLTLKINQLKANNIVYCGETNIFHEESASLKKNPVNKLFLDHNVQTFKQKWFGKYDIDHDKYLKNPSYRLI